MHQRFQFSLAGSFASVVALFAALAVGCARDSTVRDLGTRAVVIGVDGADWKIIDALVAEGELPNFEHLRRQGVWGKIATLTDIPLSPVIWTSVATGKTAAKHGVAWFMVDRPDGTRVPVRSYNRKTKAIWNILAEQGRKPVVVGWWATYPAEDVDEGAIVSDGLGFHGFGSTARDGEDSRKTYPSALFAPAAVRMPAESEIPAAFARRFLHLTEEEYRGEMFDAARMARRNPENPIHLFQMYAATAQGYTSIAEELLSSRDYDLFMMYFEQVDSFSHLFMKYAPPKLAWIDDGEFDRYQDVVTEWYKYQDELLGRVLAKIDLNETAVFLLSDHGFKSGDRRIRSERTVDVRRAHLDHETHGVFIAAGPHIRGGGGEYQGASVLDITPTVLHYLGFSVARDMDGRVLEGIFEPRFRDEQALRYVATYEDQEETKEAGTQVAEEFSAEEMAEQERALRTLGYLGGSSSREEPARAGPAAVPEGGESSPEIHNNLGRIHLSQGALDKAQAEFEQALALAPDNADALLNMGSIQRAKGRVPEAEHFVKRALRVNPNSIAALGQLAEIKRDLGELDESVRLYREALAIDDSPPFLYLGLGDSLQRLGRTEEAAGAFRTVLELDPDSFEAHYNLGVTYLTRGQIDEAAARFEKALELNPRHARAAFVLNNLGDIHLRRGQQEQAIERFRQATEAAPSHLESRYNLGVLYLQGGQVGEAIPLLEQAAALAPDHEAVGASLGMAYLLAGRNEEAYKSLLLVRRLYPRNWIAPLGLSLLHAGANEKAKARELLAEALRLGGATARAEAGNYSILKDLLAEVEAPPSPP